MAESTIDSEGFKGGTRGAPIMPRDAVSRTANVEVADDNIQYTCAHNYNYGHYKQLIEATYGHYTATYKIIISC